MAAQKFGFRSVRFKLALASTLVEIVMLAFLISNSASIATQALEDQTRYRVQEIIPLLNASLASPLVERDYATLDDILSQIVRKGGIEYIAILDDAQFLVAELGSKPPQENHIENGQEISSLNLYRQFNVPITLAGTTVGKMHLSIDTSFLYLTIRTLKREGILIASGEVVITFVLLALVGVLLTRNLATLANAARTMTGGDLSARLEINTQDEIGATARAFNAMAARLGASYNSLKRSEQRYQMLAEVSPVGIFNMNAEGQCIYVNERYSEIAGQPQERFFGMGWIDTVHPDDKNAVIAEWEHCAKTGAPYVGEYRIVNTQGAVVWVYVQGMKGDFVEGGYVGTVTDVTRLKLVEQELAKHRDSLEGLVDERTLELKAAQEKLLRQERLATLGQLTATVSHELRNPLGVISNAAYYLKRKCQSADGKLDKKVEEYLDMIKREVAAADRIIADLLSTSRTKDPVIQWVNLDDLMDSIITSSVFPAHIEWRYSRRPTPFMMRADPAQLTQVFRNLLGNSVQAIRGSGDTTGEIQLKASEKFGQYQLCLIDTGPGVDKESQEKIFEPMYTTKAKGNGLGLWISRELIRGHGGELSYVCDNANSSEKGERKGAEFKLTLPRGSKKEMKLVST